ncbi:MULTISPECIES: type II toxin-antitoxin system Phd/YefM family antitoxin [Acetobacter]|uniref:Type II toxin-antitoxin system prevent-host-death family antitoxin n=3 Tax=Acetobacter TaxID=434 RepID=A0A2G4REG8_9PROT|nr:MULTISPECIES: type II toxin-antitoxin system prevent-host-death family antitoxin [Acetobacter]ANA15260.1 prevent-host-death protein [Acetobacter oryzifermentans]AXN01857.1 type II toxin-antitoxin system prevent-host-death family antitoxin [Acetobacter pomorum]KAA8394702.1 type II toxin-antitoxin system prevent-host-death family antitoxin [Acetobacter sp. DmW_125128]KAA8397336.1 type II toxin-antitoxin system prevent-host-death family antitoxin [Acetobacter sp. DmW_125127]KAA8400320.1 type I
MQTVNLVDAKAHLSRLIDQAMQGEPVRIMRRGKVIAQINKITRERRPINLNALRALTANMTPQTVPARDMMRDMRDEARY